MRPDAQIFVHVLAAATLFGATGAVAVLALAARRRTEQLVLARAAFRTLLLLAIPAWAVMLGFGTWAKSKANWPDELGWLGVGFGVSDGGILFLLVATGLSYWWTRRPNGGWPATAVGVLSSLYLVALAVAWWAMSTKLPT